MMQLVECNPDIGNVGIHCLLCSNLVFSFQGIEKVLQFSLGGFLAIYRLIMNTLLSPTHQKKRITPLYKRQEIAMLI